MNINELIEQIGVRERLEFIAEDCGDARFSEIEAMASALLAVLNAQSKPSLVLRPFGYDGETFRKSDIDHHAAVVYYTAPPAASSPEWSNAQCMELLAVAFRHCEIRGDIEMDDIRLGVKMANAAAPAPGGDHVKQG